MPKPYKLTVFTIVRLLLACFVVGLAMTYFQVTPREVVTTAIAWGKDLADWSTSVFGSAMSYVLFGAILVVPLWLVYYLFQKAVHGDTTDET